jgi:hypothetical protein
MISQERTRDLTALLVRDTVSFVRGRRESIQTDIHGNKKLCLSISISSFTDWLTIPLLVPNKTIIAEPAHNNQRILLNKNPSLVRLPTRTPE